MTNNIVIYHANCSDGFCSAFLLWSKFGDDAIYIPMQYGKELNMGKFNSNDTIYIVDFSFKYEVIVKLGKKVRNVIVLDHHKTAQAELEGREWASNIHVEFDMNKCGAMMVWEYLNPASMTTKLVNYIQDHDLWTKKLPYTDEVSAYVQYLPFDFEVWNSLNDDMVLSFDKITLIGSAILGKIKQQVADSVRKASEHELCGHKILAVNSTVNFSEVAGELALGRPFGVAFFITNEGKWVYSLRSDAADTCGVSIDVSEIAKTFGGGGHKHAAGFFSKVNVLTW